ncbi:N-acetyl-gamma-glutamyl-phosphate reductase [Desulfocicer vacuolatum]|nr:N-acetyl-gamma-glutamyl-phosphate reductase [Desulfocicer vacuolatum]
MIKTCIAGATGYTGAELVKLISGHPNAEITAVTSRSYAGQKLTDIFPALGGMVDITCEPMDMESLKGRIDCVFLALPHKVSMSYAPFFIENNIKVIDLSADFRFKDPKAYEAAYQPHSAPDLLKNAVYGLSEIYGDAIKKADLVGNPGCYPTSLLLPLIPLIKEGMVSTRGIVSDSKSGVSGAGRALSLSSHFCEVNESFKPYKVGNHRHVPEMEEILSFHAKEPVKITFVPHLIPLTRGMVSTIYAEVTAPTTHDAVMNTLKQYYGSDAFVRLLPQGKFPDSAHVRGTNFCDIGVHVDNDSQRIILVSAIDNILKGAAGQAVQNMNLMFGMEQRLGLELIPGAI